MPRQMGNPPCYSVWRRLILERDGYKCNLCGKTKRLEVHHVIPVAFNGTLILEKSNGITLCHLCHKKIHKKIRIPRK
jgi:5-methylcytosine-specific restriction protein A